MSYVYFIAAPEAETVKIGFARDPWSRLVKAQVDSPQPLHLIAIEPGGREREAELHRIFAADRCRGEWFRMSASLRGYIARLPAAIPLERRRKRLAGPLGAWLHSRGLTAVAFAASVGTTEATISRVCAGKQLPRREIMIAIWKATGGAISPNLLYGIPSDPATEAAA